MLLFESPLDRIQGIDESELCARAHNLYKCGVCQTTKRLVVHFFLGEKKTCTDQDNTTAGCAHCESAMLKNDYGRGYLNHVARFAVQVVIVWICVATACRCKSPIRCNVCSGNALRTSSRKIAWLATDSGLVRFHRSALLQARA